MDPNRKTDRSRRRVPFFSLARGAAAILGLACVTPATWAENWEVSQATGGSCLLASARQPVNDGYQEVKAQILVDGHTVVIETDSVLDGGFSDIGLKVANEPFVPVDQIRDRKKAVFEKQYGKIVKLFKNGREVEVRLRFWPTWPATGTHSVSFSLMGFTRAYDEAGRCR